MNCVRACLFVCLFLFSFCFVFVFVGVCVCLFVCLFFLAFEVAVTFSTFFPPSVTPTVCLVWWCIITKRFGVTFDCFCSIIYPYYRSLASSVDRYFYKHVPFVNIHPSRAAKTIHCAQNVKTARLCTEFNKSINNIFLIYHILWHF